jgi:hypothetical protein
VDSIKGGIILRARLEEAGLAAPPSPPDAEAGALPIFHWVSAAPAEQEDDAA